MEAFDRLIAIMERLRGPGGCPWDAEQDHKSIMKNLVEETCELLDAIESGDPEHLREELGDVLMQVVFHSTIAKDNKMFTIAEVIDGLCDKLIYRHPHVFGEARVKDAQEVIRNWERLKRAENGKNHRDSILSGIPRTLSGLLYALKIQSLASRVGFDWNAPQEVLDKIYEELEELSEALKNEKADQTEEELGDLLFSVVNLARMLRIDPEAALRRSNKKFCDRFYEIEKSAKASGVSLTDMPMAEKDRIWEAAKLKK